MGELKIQNLQENIEKYLGNTLISSYEYHNILTIELQKEALPDLIKFLYQEPYQFQFLTDICAVHYPENIGAELIVVYHLHNLIHNIRLRLKCPLNIQKPEIQTITDIFATANWMERETFDFFGIQFMGHPNLKRILNHDQMDYHPLLKQYHLEDETRTDKKDEFFGR